MLNIIFEFRKGIFFIRLLGNFNNNNYEKEKDKISSLIDENQFRYIVINTNYIEKISLDGINHLIETFYKTKKKENNLIICDKYNIFKKLLNNSIPSIKDEIEVL